MLTAAQRARRLRQIHARRKALHDELRALDVEALPLENAESLSRGFRVPLRGARLIDAMDREAALAAVRAGRAA